MTKSPTCRLVTDPALASPGTWLSTRAQIALTACACASATAFLYAVDPNQHSLYPQCLLYKATGYYCAGCGATRALYALLHGRIFEALHDNALFIAALPVCLWLAIPYLVRTWQANVWPQTHVEGKSLLRIGIAVFGLMLAFMALRNLPGWPFDLLKPLAPWQQPV